MIKGGYTIINLKDTSITTGTPVTIAGTYAKIEKNNRKAILISGLDLDGAEISDFFTAFTVSSSNFVADIPGGKTITITAADEITIAAKG